jgi:fumarate reductase (CoM/CoB) subunit A
MEFMQQGLATTWPTQCMVMLYEMEEPYRMLNRHGKSFIENWLPDGIDVMTASKLKAFHWPVSCRDAAIHLDRAIHGEVLAGRGTENDAVYLDLSRARRGFQPEVFETYMLENGIDVGRDLLQVQIHHHTSNGGVRIDAHGHSTVPGLFACGETAGWQGADRLGGTMLGGSQVFGWRAGTRAAELAADKPDATVPADVLDRLIVEPVARMRERGGATRPQELLPLLQREMWSRLLVEKDEATLKGALAFIDGQRDRMADDLALEEPMDLALAFEQRNLLDVAEIIARAGLMRTESRGSHYRSDYPARDDANWLTNVFVTRTESGAVRLEKSWVNAENGWVDQPGDIRIQPWG